MAELAPPSPPAAARAGWARRATPERLQQFTALAIRIASAGIGYVLLAGAAHVTSLSGFGDFALVMAAAAMFGAIATLGQETLLLRRLPLIRAQGLAGYRQAIARSTRIVLPGLAGSAVLAMLYGRHSFTGGGIPLIALTGLLVAASGAAELLFATARGGGSVLGAVFRRELVWKLVLLAAIIGFYATGRQASAALLAGCYLVGALATVALSLLPVIAAWRRAPRAAAEAAAADRSDGIAFFLLNLINQAGTQIDVLVLGLMTGIPPVALGAYYAAQRTIQVLYILPYGAAITSAPKVPLAWARGDTGEIVRLSRQISREVAAVVLAIALGATLFRGAIMGFFRPEFADYALVLPVLILGPLVSAAGGLHTMIAPMCGEERRYARLRLGLILGFLLLKIAAAATHSLLLFAAVGATEQIAITLAGVVLARVKLGVWIV